MGEAVRAITRPARIATVLVSLAALALACAPSAFAGRLIVSGHDIDFHCGSAQNRECHFVNVALKYVRGSAPDPTKPVLVLDRGALSAPSAVNKAFGTGVVPMTVVDPRSAAFTTVPIDTAHFSAIFVASDTTCSGCDLNAFPSGANAVTPDSTAIFGRLPTIAAFFNAGGGILAGSGADNSFGLTFTASNVNYYAFVDAPGAAAATGPFALTTLGKSLGITDGTAGTPDDLLFGFCGGGCTHNTFGFPAAGSRLKVAEVDQGTGRFVTLFEDTDPPSTTIALGPPASTTTGTAKFVFTASEDHTSFQCRIDGGSFVGCPSTSIFNGLSEGRHTLEVRATDLVGNIEQTPKTYSWAVGFDADGDGFTRFTTPPDCDDTKASVHPGATEKPGNKTDENCDGFSAPFERAGAPFTTFFTFRGSKTKVKTLTPKKIPKGVKLTITCKGKGCAFKKKTSKPHGTTKLAKLFKGRSLGVGTKITVTLSKSGEISQILVFKTRNNAVPTTSERCQLPGKKPQSSCPAFV